MKVTNVRAVDESARMERPVLGELSQIWLDHLGEIVECILGHVKCGRPPTGGDGKITECILDIVRHGPLPTGRDCICTNSTRYKRDVAKYSIEIKGLSELHRDLQRKMVKERH